MQPPFPISQLAILSKIPRYRETVEKLLDKASEQNLEEAWEEMPFIRKADLRERFPESFGFTRQELTEMAAQQKIELERTSGTTEESVELILPEGWWARQEARALSLNERILSTFEPDPFYDNAPMPPRRVNIVSPACNNDVSFAGVPSCEARTLGRILFVNLSRHPFLWTDEAKKQMLEETLEFKPVFLDVDPVYGTLFADYCRKQNVCIPSLKYIVSSYEYLSRAHRRYMHEVFSVPVYNLYGSTESGHLLIEDEAGLVKVVRENAYLEFLPLPCDDTLKECVVTTLTNPYMPLLRYRIGDLLCKREDRYRLMGRLKDAAFTRTGECVPVAWIDDAISVSQKILHYQLIQSPDNPCDWRLDYYLRNDKGPLSDLEKRLINGNLSTFLGWDFDLEFKETDYIACEPSGKFRLILPHRDPAKGTDKPMP
jgi:phenylacetate-CoA ligase